MSSQRGLVSADFGEQRDRLLRELDELRGELREQLVPSRAIPESLFAPERPDDPSPAEPAPLDATEST